MNQEFSRLKIYLSRGFSVAGNHLVKTNKDGSKLYILMYKRNVVR